MTLVRAGIGVVHDDAAIRVAVRNEELVGLGVYHHAGRAIHVGGVVAALALVPFADLQQKLACVRELQDLVVAFAVARHPDVALVIRIHAVFGRRPLVSVSGPAKRLDELSVLVEFDNGRRRSAAARGRRTQRGRSLARRNACRPVRYPDVILAVDADPANLPGRPPVRQILEEQRIPVEVRHAFRLGDHCNSSQRQTEGKRGAAHDSGYP